MSAAYLLAKIQEHDGELELVGLEVRELAAPATLTRGNHLWATIEQADGESFPVAKRNLHRHIQQNRPWVVRYITTDPHNPVILRKKRARQQLREAVFGARAQLDPQDIREVLGEALGGSR